MRNIILVILGMTVASHGADFNDFCKAVAKVESSGNPLAYNSKENAIGIYQIRSAYFKDAQNFDKELSRFTHKDCYNPEVAKRVVWAYMSRYESKALNNNDFQSMARAHNGGCGWRSKANLTNNYWSKVSKQLN